jgi:hypothetical protein
MDLSGYWNREGDADNGYSREVVDLLGMPVSADGRAKALSYDIASLSATERQCQMYPPTYLLTGPSAQNLERAGSDHAEAAGLEDRRLGRPRRHDHLDGRPARIRRSTRRTRTAASRPAGGRATASSPSPPTSRWATSSGTSASAATAPRFTYRFTRYGDLLTVTGILEDPVYLAEPYVLTEIFKLNTGGTGFPLTACEPIEELPTLHENPGSCRTTCPARTSGSTR